jgi:CheY-like chemotaxis protein
VVREVVDLLRAAIPTNVLFQFAVSQDLNFVKADPDQLHQVIMNLGTNAAQAIGKKQGRVSIRLENREVESSGQDNLSPMVCLTVSDNGCGMDVATKDRAFDLFFTTKAPGEGTGIGLSVVHGIVQAHQGSVTLESAVGKGTKVEVLIPAVLEGLPASPEEQISVPRANGERILFVDDEVTLGLIVKRALERVGYRVDVESRPEAALARLLSHPEDHYALILTDLTMPEMSGVEMASRIHSLQPRVPIILISGYPAELTSDAVEKAGIRNILAKPIPLRLLEFAVYQAIHGPDEST